jgi:Uma2 family endonuclease
MGVHTAIPLEEYLDTTFEGLDREFRDGEVVERSMPDFIHGECQLPAGRFLFSPEKEALACIRARRPACGFRTSGS